MLSPLVYCKVVCARNGYLKAAKRWKTTDSPDDRMRLLDKKRHFFDVMDRYDFYKFERRPNDSKRILELATAKKNATEIDQKLLNAVRRKIAGKPLVEPALIATPLPACSPQA